MRELIRRRPILTYFVAALLIGIFVISLRGAAPNYFGPFMKHLVENDLAGNTVTVIAYALDGRPGFLLSLMFPLAPTLAALLIVSLGWGRVGLAELFSRFKPWREGVTAREGLKVYGVVTIVYVAITLLLLVRSYRLGNLEGVNEVIAMLGTLPGAMLLWLAVLPYVDGGALCEELGWRGYLLPKLMEWLRTPLVAAIVLGVLWGLWHMPRDIPVALAGADALQARFGGLGGYVSEWLLFIVGTTASTIICAYVFNLTGGSVVAPILVHGASNTISVNILRLTGDRHFEAFGLRWDITDFFAFPIAIAIVILAGPGLGKRSTMSPSLRPRGDVSPSLPAATR